MRRIVITCLLVFLLLPPARLRAEPALSDTEFRLGPKDQLVVSLCTGTGTKGKDQYQTYEVTVNMTGNVTLPLVGNVKASGLTVGQLEAKLAKRMREYYTHVQLSVSVREYRSAVVYLLGQIGKNGVMALEHENTPLFEVIARAGGFVDSASLSDERLAGADTRNIVITRGGRRIKLNYLQLLTEDDKVRRFIVRPGDYIYVPKPIRTIVMFGGVGRTGEQEYRPGMTLIEAIAKAGSFTEAARRNRVLVMRGQGMKKERIWVNAEKVLQGKAEDFPLKRDDMVFVTEWQ